MQPSPVFTGKEEMISATSSGGSATDQPSYFLFVDQDTEPWTEVVLNVSLHLEETHVQVDTTVPPTLSGYTALVLLYFGGSGYVLFCCRDERSAVHTAVQGFGTGRRLK